MLQYCEHFMATTEVVFALPEEVVFPLLQGTQFRITSCDQFFVKVTSKYMNLSKQKTYADAGTHGM